LAAAELALPVLFAFAFSLVRAQQADPLPPWTEGLIKSAIIQFVQAVTTQGGSDYVRPEERIATFHNDGTLWAEFHFTSPSNSALKGCWVFHSGCCGASFFTQSNGTCQ